MTASQTHSHTTKIQVRFKDIDQQGHVNNANHLTYAETSRVNYFQQILGKDVDWDETGLLLARTEIDYIEPIFLEDEIEVTCAVSAIGNKSFDMENVILKITAEEKKVCAKVKSVFVCFNYNTKSSTMVPEIWKHKFIEFEKNIDIK
ncbi:MAG: acyl-CoA thioesterase [Bacteroidota bacterium]|jgi:acyl-CoA thioester hydrolase